MVVIPTIVASKEKVKTMFDPTSSSVVNEATKEMLKELEWRLNSEIEYKEE